MSAPAEAPARPVSPDAATRVPGHRQRSLLAMLAVIVAADGLLTAWNAGLGGYSNYYATAARSMSMSWRAFFFGAFDPGGTVTLDKLAGFLIPQAVSAHLFGFHVWSLALPQVLEGMVTVVAAYLIGLRWLGAWTGLFAAAATASTPLLASMFGHTMEDGLLTMSLALAFVQFQKAIRDGRLLPLLFCAGWVAVGFQAKMLQAWLILPGLAAGYLVAAPLPMVRRLLQCAAAGAAAVVLSLSWMTAIQLTPAADRPYIDGSTNNNVYSMVFGFDGLNRLLPNLVPGAIGDAVAHHGHSRLVGSTRRLRVAEAGPPGNRPDKLVLPVYLTQIGWLYPLAGIGILLSLWPLIRSRRRLVHRRRWRLAWSAELPAAAVASAGTAVALAGWLVASVGFLTLAKIPHTAYLAAVSVQVAVFAGVGFTRAARVCGPGLRRAVFPIVVGVQACWAVAVLPADRVAPVALIVLACLLGVVAVAAALAGRRGPWRRPAVAVAALAVLAVPAMWSAYVLDPARNGSASDAYAGPLPAGDASWFQQPPARSFAVPPPFRTAAAPRLSAAEEHLLGYVRAQHVGPGPLLATDGWEEASNFIIDAGADVWGTRGYSGQAPTISTDTLRRLTATGRLRFVLLSDSPHYAGQAPESLRRWVRQNCDPAGPGLDIPRSRHSAELTLYRCTDGGTPRGP